MKAKVKVYLLFFVSFYFFSSQKGYSQGGGTRPEVITIRDRIHQIQTENDRLVIHCAQLPVPLVLERRNGPAAENLIRVLKTAYIKDYKVKINYRPKDFTIVP